MTARFVLLAMLIAVPASAQRVTLGANVGGSSANADLGSSTGWKSGWSAGANLTYRLTSRFGFRADANLAQNDPAGTATVPGGRSARDWPPRGMRNVKRSGEHTTARQT